MIISEKLLDLNFDFNVDEQKLFITNNDNFDNVITSKENIVKMLKFFNEVSEKMK